MNADSKSLKVEVPWHKFGTKLENVSTAEDAVRTVQLDLKQGKEVSQKEDKWERKHIYIENAGVFNFFDPIVTAGAATYDSIGIVDKVMWISARMADDIVVSENDTVGEFVLLAHKHGASNAPTMRCRSFRFAGEVTLSDDLLYPLVGIEMDANGRTQFEVPTESAVAKIREYFDTLGTRFRAMAEIELDQSSLLFYLESVFPQVRTQGRGAKYKSADQRDKAIQQCAHLFMEAKAQGRGALWDAYCAVNQYVDYFETSVDDPRRLNQIWGSPLKTYAFMQAKK